jgi:hypothetical protein
VIDVANIAMGGKHRKRRFRGRKRRLGARTAKPVVRLELGTRREPAARCPAQTKFSRLGEQYSRALGSLTHRSEARDQIIVSEESQARMLEANLHDSARVRRALAKVRQREKWLALLE